MTDRSTSTFDQTTGAGGDAATDHPLAETGKEAGERAGHLVERGADIGFQQADRGLQQAASGAESVAKSIRRVSSDMQTDQPQIADVANAAADQAEALARFLRETDVRQMVSSVEDLARRQPLLFLGGAFVLGVAASRLIKAAGGTRAQGQGQWQGQRYSMGPGYETGAIRTTASTASTGHNGGL